MIATVDEKPLPPISKPGPSTRWRRRACSRRLCPHGARGKRSADGCRTTGSSSRTSAVECTSPTRSRARLPGTRPPLWSDTGSLVQMQRRAPADRDRGQQQARLRLNPATRNACRWNKRGRRPCAARTLPQSMTQHRRPTYQAMQRASLSRRRLKSGREHIVALVCGAVAHRSCPATAQLQLLRQTAQSS